MSSFLPVPHIPYSDDPNQLGAFVPLFRQNGFVRIDGVFSAEEVARMKDAMAAIVDGLDPDQHPRTTFNTSDEQKHVKDWYFLESVDKIRFFYEENAVDQASGKLLVEKQKALNKVGHALHWLDPEFRHFTFHPKINQITRLLGAKCPRVAQSMYIFKQPKIGGAANEHVDSTFLHCKNRDDLLGVWIALDQARMDNGCLWFIPGSHKECLDKTKDYKFVRNQEAISSERGGPLLKFIGVRPSFDSSQFVPVKCDKGSVVLIHGDVVHKSEANCSEQSRHAYTFHLVDFGHREQDWAKSNWIQETTTYKFPAIYE